MKLTAVFSLEFGLGYSQEGRVNWLDKLVLLTPPPPPGHYLPPPPGHYLPPEGNIVFSLKTFF